MHFRSFVWERIMKGPYKEGPSKTNSAESKQEFWYLSLKAWCIRFLFKIHSKGSVYEGSNFSKASKKYTSALKSNLALLLKSCIKNWIHFTNSTKIPHQVGCDTIEIPRYTLSMNYIWKLWKGNIQERPQTKKWETYEKYKVTKRKPKRRA